MTVETSETQDYVEPVATENTDAESQENQEQDTEQGEQSQEPEKVETEKPKRNRAQERIEQLARENAELKRERAQQQEKSKASEIKRPIIDDFDDYGEYENALEDYHVSKAEERVLNKLNERDASKNASIRESEYQTAAIELEDQGINIGKYVQRANELPQLPIQLDQFGLSASDTLKLAKELLDDEDTYIALTQMNPVQAAAKIGYLIESKKGKTLPPVSKAPKPITPVKASVPASREPSSMTTAEYIKYRNSQKK